MDNQQLHELAMSYASTVLAEYLRRGTDDESKKFDIYMDSYKFAVKNIDNKLKDV